MNLLDAAKRKSQFYPILILLGLFLVLTLPSAIQQFGFDRLPASGDLIHRRVVYFLTNFPDFVNAPEVLLSHSQFYHHGIATYNLLTGLTSDRAFYGMTIMGYVTLFLGILTLFILIRRINVKWAPLAPIFVFSNPNIVLPFLGHANQHLIFVFFGLFIFVIFNFRPTIWTHAAAVLMLGVTLNSSLAIGLPLILTILILELFRPTSKAIMIFVIAFLLYLPYLTVPIRYLAFSDPSGTLNFLPFFFWITLLGLVTTGLFHRYIDPRTRLRKALLCLAIGVSVIFFIFPRSQGPFAVRSTPNEITSAQEAYRTINMNEYLFSINPGKGFVGFNVFQPITILFILLGIIAIIQNHRSLNPSLRLMLIILLIPPLLSILRLGLFAIFFEKFSRSALIYLLPGRMMLITFFLLPIFFLLPLEKLRSHIGHITIMGAVAVLVVNVYLVSSFAAHRVHSFSQKQSQTIILQSLKRGVGENLLPIEGLYACKYFNQCKIRTFSSGGF